MTTVTADSKLLSQLTSSDSLVEVRNAEGVVVGFFAPVRMEYADQYALLAAKAHSSGSPRVARTTTEVLDDLESVGKQQ